LRRLATGPRLFDDFVYAVGDVFRVLTVDLDHVLFFRLGRLGRLGCSPWLCPTAEAAVVRIPISPLNTCDVHT